MRHILVSAASALCLCALAGCGSNNISQYNQQMKVALKDYYELMEVCRAVKQESQIESAAPKLRELRTRIDKDCQQLRALEPSSAEEKLRLQKKYGYIVLSLRASLVRYTANVAGPEKGKAIAAEVFGNLPLPLPEVNGSPFPDFLVKQAQGQQ